jgi:adenine-specific DNA methylase
MTKYPKRLIEVDLPIKELSKLRNKRPSLADLNVRRVGLWWSRKPQHQARAVWLSMMLPDPADDCTSDDDRSRIREILLRYSYLSEAGRNSHIGLRADLIRLCRELAEPSRITSRRTIDTLRDFAKAFAFEEKVALDPFAGGGSIPVEAQRLGLNTIASDYNPISCLFLRAMMEWGQKLSPKELDSIVASINDSIDSVLARISDYYPEHPKYGHPIGYIRIRQLQCEGPACGRIIPATSKFELNAKDRTGLIFAGTENNTLQLKVATAPARGFPKPTMRDGALTCPIDSCGFTTPRSAVVKQWAKHKLAPKLVAVVYRNDTDHLVILDPLPQQVAALARATAELGNPEIGDFIPTEDWPRTELRRFSPPLYGYTRYSDCHTERQLLYIAALCQSLKRNRIDKHADVAAGLAALLIAQVVDKNSSFCRWRNDRGGSYENTFAGKSLGMIWDFFEADPLHAVHSLKSVLNDLRESILAAKIHLVGEGTVLNVPAQELALPDDSVDVLYTDPPYYDQIPYSHLSDWPFVWMRRVGAFDGQAGPDGLVAKNREVVVDRPHSQSPTTHDGAYFRLELRKCFERLQLCMKTGALGVVVFAHQETSAWESLLEGLLEAGFCVTASWPIETERGGRLQAQGTASLQSSIHLVVRPRRNFTADGHLVEVGEWREVLHNLPIRIHQWLPRLAEEGIVGADAIFACLGPALEVFSRYSRVEKANGETVALGEYLEHVWAAVAKEALALVFEGADATGFEADARLTAMWLWTLKAPDSNGNAEDVGDDEESDDDQEGKKPKISGFKLEYDAARKIAQGLGAHLESLTHLVEVSGDQARLLPVSERTKHLFGKDEEEPTRAGGRKKSSAQLNMFAELTEAEDAEVAWKEKTVKRVGETALDRVHQAMILFAAGRGEALKRFVVEDGVGQDGKFWRLAQALSALYPSGTDEKRWVDGLLARKKQFGF